MAFGDPPPRFALLVVSPVTQIAQESHTLHYNQPVNDAELISRQEQVISICESGAKMMEPFTEKVIKIIKNIPSGYVMSYGQIARVAGNPRSARQVVRILHSMSKKHALPWHRVINSKGEIGIQDEELFVTQKSRLESEGVEFKGKNRVDIETYRYSPDCEDTI